MSTPPEMGEPGNGNSGDDYRDLSELVEIHDNYRWIYNLMAFLVDWVFWVGMAIGILSGYFTFAYLNAKFILSWQQDFMKIERDVGSYQNLNEHYMSTSNDDEDGSSTSSPNGGSDEPNRATKGRKR